MLGFYKSRSQQRNARLGDRSLILQAKNREGLGQAASQAAAGGSSPPKKKSSAAREFGDEYKHGNNRLGRGSFGIVHEATKKTTGETVAVKIIRKSRPTSVGQILSLENEIQLLKELQHDNIIRLHDDFEDHKYWYLVTELMKGGDLLNRIKEMTCYKYKEDEARELFKNLLDGIWYCHKKFIVHRDLKLENILLVSEDNNTKVKIADFGLASKCLPPNYFLTTYRGTPRYMAPEILERVPYNTKVDMWSLGVILYILLCGHLPFKGKDKEEIIEDISRGHGFPEEYWGSVSNVAKDLITKLLTVDPAKRLSANLALEHEWFVQDEFMLVQDGYNGANIEEDIEPSFKDQYVRHTDSTERKEHLSVVVCGQDNAGKTTTCGQLEKLYGNVQQAHTRETPSPSKKGKQAAAKVALVCPSSSTKDSKSTCALKKKKAHPPSFDDVEFLALPMIVVVIVVMTMKAVMMTNWWVRTVVARILMRVMMIIMPIKVARKSTTCGHLNLIFKQGGISAHEMERGVTIQCNTKEFFAEKYRYTFVDATDKNMIAGSATADVALLLVSAEKGGAEADAKLGVEEGETRQHARLLYWLGVKQVIVGINKMDFCEWSEDCFNFIKEELVEMLRSIGFDPEKIPFIPYSGLNGDNLVEKSDKCPWYKGWKANVTPQKIIEGFTIVEALNNFITPSTLPIFSSSIYNIEGVGHIF